MKKSKRSEKRTHEPFYQILQANIRQKRQKIAQEEIANLEVGKSIRKMRQQKQLSGVDLCRRAGDLDPRTLNALERGRIRNPSIKTLRSLARGLEMSVSDLFRKMETRGDQYFYLGSQKGAFQLEFPGLGLKAVSYTPPLRDFFCGKLSVAPKRKLTEMALKHSLPLFISVLVGKFEVEIEGRKFLMKEGENLFFHASLKHSFYNPMHRESVLLLVSAPSFL